VLVFKLTKNRIYQENIRGFFMNELIFALGSLLFFGAKFSACIAEARIKEVKKNESSS